MPKKVDRRHHFKQVLTNPFWDLVDVVPQLGVSKQRATQLFQHYFGMKYSLCNRMKKDNLKRELACWDMPRHPVHFLFIYSKASRLCPHFEAEIKFIEELKKYGLSWSYKRKRPTGTYFEVGGSPCRVAVRTCGEARLVCPEGPKYYKFVSSLLPMDFLACLRPDTEQFYIIPSVGHVYIRTTEIVNPWAGTNHVQYLEAWDLLK